VTADLDAREEPPRVRRRLVARVVLALGVVGFAMSMTGVVVQMLPRHFTPAQVRQIMAWEVGGRWRQLPAGRIFQASVGYQLSATAIGAPGPLALSALRVAIAPQSGCAEGVTNAATAAVLDRGGCQTVIRATYVDETRSYVMTVGVAVLATHAAAVAAAQRLTTTQLASDVGGAGRLASGVLVVSFHGAAAELYDYTRQLSGSIATGPYVVMYAAGYADRRPRVQASLDHSANTEMTSMADGVAQSVVDTLGAPPAPPHCPGAPGC
jgi:hypothetical protein